MASKIFTGDMPEMMENILSNLRNEHYSLYSCALVNRHWCKISIPILWSDPFSFNKLPNFISRYFSFLNDDEKTVLRECGSIGTIISNTLFPYAKFLKVLDLLLFVCKVQLWVESLCTDPLRQVGKEIVNLLLKLFIKSGATLSNLRTYINFTIKPEIFYLLGKNETFFSRLQDVSVEGVSSESNMDGAIMLLRILAENATNICSLSLNTLNSIHAQPINEVFASIIKPQQHIRRIILNYQLNLHSIVSALESQCKSLQEIKIFKCDCSDEFRILMDCENLKVFRAIYSADRILLRILSTSICKLTILEISSNQFDASNVIQILERSGSLLQRLKLESSLEVISQSSLLETLTNFCPNITYLYISSIKFSTQLPRLIQGLQRLQFLTLKWIRDENERANVIKKRVIRLAKLLPSTLRYLEWKALRSNPHNDDLLNNCNAPLGKLLIHVDFGKKKLSETLIKFHVRKKTLRYVNVTSTDLNLVKDFEGYVIHVPYEKLVVHC
ncbi:hypothetical protein F8M41_022424 [Gigaspora margarita]|uniref:F-box domain-containing protein n=1 Tax=Gigaspora margarita TaxID=4874 RepID=A0A8H4EI17_GIGMA|nr:hypothetical protein F8M41_022424 [Gigaspora margarita]